jgi:N-acetylglucosaminyl-diphospho-decaprenol L-rhamnosyltransferase
VIGRVEGPDKGELLDVIIVTYNSAKEISQCLAAARHALVGIDARIYVIDNNSSDGTVGVAVKSGAEIVVNERNEGFSKACNMGLSRGRGKFTLFLNPDCILHMDALRSMLTFLLQQPDYVAVGPRIESAEGDVSRAAARRLPSLWGQCCQLLWLDRIFDGSRLFASTYYQPWAYADERDVECLSGAALMCRSDVLRTLGGLDERVPLYLDDIDLCARLHRYGRLRYIASASAVHYQNRSGRQHGRKVIQIVSLEARRVYFETHHGVGAAAIFRLIVAVSGFVWIAITPLAFLCGRGEWGRRSAVRGRSFLEWAFARAGRKVVLPG